VAVNHELVLLYWDIRRGIVEKQQALDWGDSVVDQVSTDLQAAFPGTTGFSPRNLRSAKQFYLAYSDSVIWLQPVAKLAKQPGDGAFWPQPAAELTAARVTAFLQHLVAEIPWGQNLLILNKLTEPTVRLYYLRATARFGWSRNVLLNQIKAGAYERAVTEKKTHNFPLALPEYLAEQADEAMKSSYNLEFLGIRREVKERELEDRLISRLQAFLLELGYGFCFVGRKHRLNGACVPPTSAGKVIMVRLSSS
jgi:predicted nuclease of restriction endonuclease-like (RecB) superfamily